MADELFLKVRQFVHESSLASLDSIGPKTSLYVDLAFDLEKATGFFKRFATEFKIEMNGVDLIPYFVPHQVVLPDGGGPAGLIWLLFLWMDRHRRAGVRPLLVRDLVAMARAGRWCL